MNGKVLVLGSSGPISEGLKNFYGDAAIILGRTHPRHDYFDLQDLNSFSCLEKFKADYAVLLSSLSGFKPCEVNPSHAFRMNIYASSVAVSILNKKNIPVVFVSSSSVFGSRDLERFEHSNAHPETVYGTTKYQLERHILRVSNVRNSVVRLTKLCHPYLPIILRWREALARGDKIYALKGMRVSPLPLSVVLDYIVEVATKRVPGVTHLTSDGELSYADLAKSIFPGAPVIEDNEGSVDAQAVATLSVSRPESVSITLDSAIQEIKREIQRCLG